MSELNRLNLGLINYEKLEASYFIVIIYDKPNKLPFPKIVFVLVCLHSIKIEVIVGTLCSKLKINCKIRKTSFETGGKKRYLILKFAKFFFI
jgi:hypothetical protein